MIIRVQLIHVWEIEIVLVYVDDCLIFSRNNSGISGKLVHSLTHGKEQFEFTNKGDMLKYLAIDIIKYKDGSIKFTQPHLIDRFVKLIGRDKILTLN